MRLQMILTTLVCCLVVLSSSVAEAVSFQLFSSGAGDIYRHSVTGAGTPSANGSISVGAGIPGKMTVSPDDELFVSVGSGNVVNRYVDLDSTFIANPTNPTITSVANIDNPNGLRFRGDELFINNIDDNQVVRYNFDGSGAAVANPPFTSTSGHLTSTRGRGVAFSPTGDQMYVTGCCGSTNVIAVYGIDGAGLVTHQNNISTGDLTGFGLTLANAQAITVSDTGELWVADTGTDASPALAEIARLTVDGSGNLTAGSIAISSSETDLLRPVDLTFAPDGELFIANLGSTSVSGDGFLSRFTFDGGGAITSSSQFGIADSYRGVSIFFVPPVPEPSSFLLLGLGALGLMRHTRRRGKRTS